MSNSPLSSLSGVNLSLFDTPVEQPPVETPPAQVDISALVRIRRISTGQQILLSTVHPAPQSALDEADRLGLPLFTVNELPAMKQFAQMLPEEMDKLLAIKQTWPGCTVFKHEVLP